MTMLTEKFLVPDMSGDLYMSYYGSELCPPGHLYGPAVRDHYLYVFIARGRGIYKVRDREYELREGQAFVLFPNELTLYRADDVDPWDYMWIGFGGKAAKSYLEQSDLHAGRPIVTHRRPERILQLFAELIEREPSSDVADRLFATGSLYAILAEICGHSGERPTAGGKRRSELYIAQAQGFMKQHFDKDIQVDGVARFVGLERTYFSKLFKAHTGQSPYGYIMDLRLAEARRLLQDSDMPVEHIALRIGFKDTFHFSSFFKKKTGHSPLHYRRRQ